MTGLTVAQCVAQALRRHGVEVIFGAEPAVSGYP
jgi:thiamine pyrophosphate-dependent acetolactate synthase large subunit-like protein